MTSEIFGTDSLRNIAKNCLPEYEARFVLYAADKIDALRAENERLKAEVERLQISEVEQIARNISEMRAIQVRAENERLRGLFKQIEDHYMILSGRDLRIIVETALRGGDA